MHLYLQNQITGFNSIEHFNINLFGIEMTYGCMFTANVNPTTSFRIISTPFSNLLFYCVGQVRHVRYKIFGDYKIIIVNSNITNIICL